MVMHVFVVVVVVVVKKLRYSQALLTVGTRQSF